MPAIKEDDVLIGSYSHEAHLPRADEALQMLRRIASLVKPIMRVRGWRVGQLCEFNPDWEDLLGTNEGHGIRINLRLRNPPDKRQFFEFEFIMDTMLHELTHIRIGPHNKKFQALWDELRAEYKALRSNGYTGEGFLSPGYKVGGFVYKNPQELTRLARAAAETQKAQISFGPRRIGGPPPPSSVDIRKTIADAAQRRIDMLKACEDYGANPKAKGQVLADMKRYGVKTAGEVDDAYTQAVQQAFMDMVKEEGFGNSQSRTTLRNSSITQTKHAKPGSTSRNAGKSKITSKHDQPLGRPASESSNGKWACPICTYHNPATFLCCEVCLIEKPIDPVVQSSPPPQQSLPSQFSQLSADDKAARSKSATDQIAKLTEAEKQLARTRPRNWTCHKCRTVVDHQWWLCTNCQTMRLTS